MLAARIQHRQEHQVRQRKQPLIGLLPRWLIRACDKAEVPAARQTVEMLHADARQAGNLRVRKDLLARLDLDHAFALIFPLFIPGLPFSTQFVERLREPREPVGWPVRQAQV